MTSSFGGIHGLDYAPRAPGVSISFSENHASSKREEFLRKTGFLIATAESAVAKGTIKEERKADNVLTPMDTLAQSAPGPGKDITSMSSP
jgi:hypothetical protein